MLYSWICRQLGEILPLARFSYNNSYQFSVKMTPFEALYEWKYRTLLQLLELNERKLFKIELIKEIEDKVRIIRDYLKVVLDQ